MKASITIFQNSLDYEHSSSPIEIPSEVFEAVKQVMAHSKPQIVRSQEGFFLIEPSLAGPFTEQFFPNKEWLPVKVSRISQWHSGGIRQEEFKDYLNSIQVISQDED